MLQERGDDNTFITIARRVEMAPGIYVLRYARVHYSQSRWFKVHNVVRNVNDQAQPPLPDYPARFLLEQFDDEDTRRESIIVKPSKAQLMGGR